eukprot:COSAG02_NODE_4390_length_5418_cov_18.741681_5_plen_104_part_00
MLQTSDGVALAGKDYTAQKGSLVFEDGETEKEIKIPIVTDCMHIPFTALTIKMLAMTHALPIQNLTWRLMVPAQRCRRPTRTFVFHFQHLKAVHRWARSTWPS